MNERLAHFFDFNPSGAFLSSMIVMILVVILMVIVGIKAHRQDPLKPSKGLLMWAEFLYEKVGGWMKSNMGEGWESFTAYFMALWSYLFIAFIWSLTGLPSIIDNTFAPLALALVMWVLIQKTAIKFTKIHYLHRYVEPIFVFLPINIISQLAPILSTTFRMFGNALSGTIIIALVQFALNGISDTLFSFMGAGLSSIWLSPIPTAVLNLYFGLFSGFIQTLVFCSLNAIWISNERPEEAMGTESQALRGPAEKKAI